ncbi:hypothetical protein RCL1_001926 [Eukaryota sp. TZLM3-RCL]
MSEFDLSSNSLSNLESQLQLTDPQDCLLQLKSSVESRPFALSYDPMPPPTEAPGPDMFLDPLAESVLVGAVEIPLKSAFRHHTLSLVKTCASLCSRCLFVQFNGRVERLSWTDVHELLFRVYAAITQVNASLPSVVYFTPFRSSFFADSHIQTLFYDDALPEFLAGIHEGRSRLSMPPLILRKVHIPVEHSLIDFHSPSKDASLFLSPCVLVGGTFDRLHNGHRLLLESAAMACSGKLIVGITEDSMCQNKSNSELIQSFSQRYSAVQSFLTDVAPRVLILEIVPLTDDSGPALLVPEGLIMVTEETQPAVARINSQRELRGLLPLEHKVVGSLVMADGTKLSSSYLRQIEAASNAEVITQQQQQ